mgnify:CR=1 FL=1
MKNTSIEHKEKIFFSYDERQEFLEKNKDTILNYDLKTINGTHGEEYILYYDYEEIFKLKTLKTYTVIQTYTAQDIYKNVEAYSKEEAILKIGELSVDEMSHEEVETEVKEQE